MDKVSILLLPFPALMYLNCYFSKLYGSSLIFNSDQILSENVLSQRIYSYSFHNSSLPYLIRQHAVCKVQ